MKVEFDKLDNNKLTNAPTGLNILRLKVGDLDVCKLKAASAALKKLSDVVHNEVVTNKDFSTLKAKINNLKKKVPETTTLVDISQYNTDKQNLEKKWKCWLNNTRYKWFGGCNCFE